jgi:hypothetical protein
MSCYVGKGDVAIVRVRKDVMLLRERGKMAILFPGKLDKYHRDYSLVNFKHDKSRFESQKVFHPKLRILYSGRFNCYLYNVIPLFGIIMEEGPLYLSFVKEKLRPRIIQYFMCTVPMHDRGQSNWPKPAEI